MCVCVCVCVCPQDPASLKRFLKREDVQELPKEEVPWEVPEPPRPELPPGTREGGREGGRDVYHDGQIIANHIK